MVVFEAVSKALDSESYKEEICKGVDNFGGVDGSIIVLESKRMLASGQTLSIIHVAHHKQSSKSLHASSHQFMVDVASPQ